MTPFTEAVAAWAAVSFHCWGRQSPPNAPASSRYSGCRCPTPSEPCRSGFHRCVQGDLGGLPCAETGGVGGRELEGQQDGGIIRITATSWPAATASPGATLMDTTVPSISVRTYWRSRRPHRCAGPGSGPVGPVQFHWRRLRCQWYTTHPGLDHIPSSNLRTALCPVPGLDFIRIGRRDGARIAEHIGDAPLFRRHFQIGDAGSRLAGLHPGQGKGTCHRSNAHHSDDFLLSFFRKAFRSAGPPVSAPGKMRLFSAASCNDFFLNKV